MFKDQIQLLGYTIEKNDCILSNELPYPEDRKQLNSILGMINYCRKFILNLSSIQSLLLHVLKKYTQFKFNIQCKEDSDKIKQNVISNRVLKHFNTNDPILLSCDTSAFILLEQYYLSQIRKMSNVLYHLPHEHLIKHSFNQANCCKVDKEAIAIIFGVHQFINYLQGNTFKLLFDCKPPVSIFGSMKTITIFTRSRLQRN